jgi:glycosyltransferase involved in cell wall biosynthesis
MKQIYYVTFSSIPSSLPSSLQIIKTCEALSSNNYNVTLIKPGTGSKETSINKYYGLVNYIHVKEFSFFTTFPRGLNFYLYCLSCFFFILNNKKSVTISRNYFICFLLILFKQKVILEIHHDTNVEGRITKFILRYFNFLNKKYLIRIVAISNSVKNLFINKYNVNPKKIKVLPSGSSIRINQLPKINKNKRLKLGYFGSFTSSKGIDTLIRLSKIDLNNDYYLYGGNKKNLEILKKQHINKNLFLRESIPYRDLKKELIKMDFLMIPYRKVVRSAGEVDDISKYTSPLKLFDYLAVGKIILSSNLKVLREVINERNAYFVNNYENIYEWKKIIKIAKNSRDKNLIMSLNNLNLSKKYDHKKRVKKYL